MRVMPGLLRTPDSVQFHIVRRSINRHSNVLSHSAYNHVLSSQQQSIPTRRMNAVLTTRSLGSTLLTTAATTSEHSFVGNMSGGVLSAAYFVPLMLDGSIHDMLVFCFVCRLLR